MAATRNVPPPLHLVEQNPTILAALVDAFSDLGAARVTWELADMRGVATDGRA